jgi:serine/threonine protein kinase
MGCVYRAEHLGLGQRRAVKVLHEERARDTEAAERFLREARMAAKLRHENIMEVIDVGEHDGIPYYVMEWLDGVDLAAVIEREGRLSWERTRGFALQICAGLDLAHRAGVVHRDMKPENCLVLRRADGAERLKILDFGIAKDYTSKQTALTATGEIMGTVYYMPPEQMHGRGDHRVDIYAVGVMLYEMLSGSPAVHRRDLGRGDDEGAHGAGARAAPLRRLADQRRDGGGGGAGDGVGCRSALSGHGGAAGSASVDRGAGRERGAAACGRRGVRGLCAARYAGGCVDTGAAGAGCRSGEGGRERR